MIAAIVGSAAAMDWKSYPESVEKGDILVNAGIGFGAPLSTYGKTKIPPIQASVDFAFSSPFTLGGLFGFTTTKWESEWDDDYDITYTGLAFAGRFGYHPDFGVPNLAVSANAVMGFFSFNVSSGGEGAGIGVPLFGVYIDGRYFFTKNIGIFAEFGFSWLSLATVGVALKF
jgi:hypothetical protein